MGLIDRINAAVLRRVRPSPAGDAAAIAARLDELVRLVAVLDAGYVGDTATLLAELPHGRLLRSDEHDPDWPQLLTALDRDGRAACSSQSWMLRLVAGGPGTAIVLIGEQP